MTEPDSHPMGGRALSVPGTDEGVLLDGPTEHLAHGLWLIREMESAQREAKTLISRELTERMDHAVSYTLRDGDFEIGGKSPESVLEYDLDALTATLRDLRERDMISAEAAQAAVREKVTYEPAKRGIQALLKLGGEIRERVETCQRPPKRERRVTVKRSASEGRQAA